MRTALEVADIFRRHGAAYRSAHDAHMGRVERRIMGAIEVCRTASLGGHVEACEDCRHSRIAYNSCRNRHCPKCQGLARAEWLADRQADLLPAPYFHVVFTVPAEVAAMAFQNKAVIYAILFQAAAETLRTIAADPRHLGAAIGFIAMLHTWGQTLTHHPHLHCVVPGGGLSPDGARWIACRPNFFLPIHVLSRFYRRLFLERLQAAFDAGRLRFFGDMARLAEARAFAAQTKRLRKISWVVYAKPPFGSPDQVLAYLGRYTHRVAIANSRLVAHRRDPGPVPLARLSTGEPKQADDARRTRVHPPLPAPRPARRIPPHPSLRLPGQRAPPEQARPDPAAARPTRTAANPPQRRLSRARARTDRRRSQSLPLLWRRHARHRYLAVHQSAANPASLVSRPMTIRHRARPNSVYAAVVPSRAAARQTACASRQIPDSAPSLAPPEPATPLARSRPAQIHGAIAFQTPSRRIPSPPEIDAATKSP